MTQDATIKTALLVDDDEIDQMLYQRLIKKLGVIENVVAFQYADEALDYLGKTDRDEIDVIFLDINMPRMSGLEFLKLATDRFGESFAKMVVIMLTTSLDPADQKEAESYEVVKAYYNKPLTAEHLADVISLLSS